MSNVQRRGKYLLLRLDRGFVVLHFRLDGQLLWFESGKVAGHVDVALHFAGGALGFVDRRHFGRLHWHEQLDEVPGLRRMGVEPLSRTFTPRLLHSLLKAANRPVKLFLLDQRRIAGLGNIYSCESLWRAGIHPKRGTGRVTEGEALRLHKAIVRVLRRALECCCHPAPDFRDAAWWFQGLDKILGVYDREGEPCRRCRTTVRRIEQGGRSTYYCPRCQP